MCVPVYMSMGGWVEDPDCGQLNPPQQLGSDGHEA